MRCWEVHVVTLTPIVRSCARYTGVLTTETASVRTTSAAQATHARTSQRPCNRVSASPDRLGLTSVRAGAYERSIEIFLLSTKVPFLHARPSTSFTGISKVYF